MPTFAFTPVDDDPFASDRPDAARGVIDYASQLDAVPVAPGGQDIASRVIRRTASNAGNLLMTPVNALGEFGNRLTGKSSPGLEIDSSGVPRDTSAMDTAATLSGAVMEGGLAMPRPSNALGVFGGMNAKTANLELLGDAMRADVDGAAPEAIHAQTGWFKGTDGKWRFEISDKGSSYNKDALNIPDHYKFHQTMDTIAQERGFRNWYSSGHEAANIAMAAREKLGQIRSLGSVLDHSELYAAYPSLRKIPVEAIDAADDSGYYDPADNRMAVAPDATIASPHSIALHEVQHAIQTREGFAHGGAPNDPEVARLGQEVVDDVESRRIALRDKLAKSPIVSEHDAVEYTYLTRLIGKLGRVDVGTIGYNSLAGEVEARNVQTRHAENTPTSSPPWLTEDTPKMIQKVRNPLGWYRGAHE